MENKRQTSVSKVRNLGTSVAVLGYYVSVGNNLSTRNISELTILNISNYHSCRIKLVNQNDFDRHL